MKEKSKKNKKKINNNDRIILPGPEVRGDPFWCLMEWQNNKLTGNVYAFKPGFCLFFKERDAENFKRKMSCPAQRNWVIRGINRRFLNLILKQYAEYGKSLLPLLLVCPTPRNGEKVPLVKTTPNEIRYFIENGNFKDTELQNFFNQARKITEQPGDNVNKKLVVDPFFEHIDQTYKNYPRPYWNMKKVLNSYKNHLWKDAENLEKEVDDLLKKRKNKGQVYTRTVYLTDCEFEISWSITDIGNIVRKNNIQKVQFILDDLVPLVDQSNIVQKHLENVVNNDNPIYVIRNPAWDPNLCVIDGNHRVIAKYTANQKTIDGYLIEPEHHIEAMIFNFHKTMYKCHNNILEYQKYMIKEKEMNELNIFPL